ncbi:MAG: C_GCAxxG_C_C family protein [Synergistaceae bacterium]|nr:C_GCAxxG_C_C family protein [Synergistaceae bacterium]
MTAKQERAVELKNRTGDAHYNCAQAVACVFSEETGVSEETMKKLGAGFGLGMGTMEATCGALCGAQMVLGLMKYEGKPIRKDAAELYKAFTDKCGASICKELKGVGTGKVLCSCDDCVRNAVKILEGMLTQ